MVNALPRLLHPRERYPVPILREAGVGPRAGLKECGKSSHTEIRSPGSLARSGCID